MTRVIAATDGDLVIGRMSGDGAGIEIPAQLRHLPVERLRVAAGEVIDAGGVTDWFVDIDGRLHLDQDDAETRQPLACAWEDALVRDGDGWRVETAEESDVRALAALWASHRLRRDRLLAASDWTQIPDAPLSEAARAAWATYRQALRDLPQDFGDPAAIVWPEAPR